MSPPHLVPRQRVALRGHPFTEDCDCCGTRPCQIPAFPGTSGGRVVPFVGCMDGSVQVSQRWSPINVPLIWSASGSAALGHHFDVWSPKPWRGSSWIRWNRAVPFQFALSTDCVGHAVRVVTDRQPSPLHRRQPCSPSTASVRTMSTAVR